MNPCITSVFSTTETQKKLSCTSVHYYAVDHVFYVQLSENVSLHV